MMIQLFEYSREIEFCDFFIQLKGENAGKPLKNHIPNSIGIKVNRELLVPEFLYYVVLNLYNTEKFRVNLKGSVIPYITIKDISIVIYSFFIK